MSLQYLYGQSQMRYKHIFLVAVLTVTACTTISPEKQVLVACQGYASTLTILAARRAAGKLTDTQVDLINILRPGLNKICLDGNFSDPSVAYDIVQDSMFKLIQVERGSQ